MPPHPIITKPFSHSFAIARSRAQHSNVSIIIVISIIINITNIIRIISSLLHGEVGVADQVHVHLLAAPALSAPLEGVEVISPRFEVPGLDAVHALALFPGGARVALTEALR